MKRVQVQIAIHHKGKMFTQTIYNGEPHLAKSIGTIHIDGFNDEEIARKIMNNVLAVYLASQYDGNKFWARLVSFKQMVVNFILQKFKT
jgi:hypothetical protein